MITILLAVQLYLHYSRSLENDIFLKILKLFYFLFTLYTSLKFNDKNRKGKYEQSYVCTVHIYS
jgi:hypothetical protein